MITHANATATSSTSSTPHKQPRKAPNDVELARALEHADNVAPPDDAALHYLTPSEGMQRVSARALGALAAQVRRQQIEMRRLRRQLKAAGAR